jgi:hypothetical protein
LPHAAPPWSSDSPDVGDYNELAGADARSYIVAK